MRQRKNRILVGVAIGVAVTVGTSIAAANASNREGESGLDAKAIIDALDRCVQDRFIRTDNGFGFARISAGIHNTSQFIPVNDTERVVVRELETRSIQVVMYLASWQKARLGPAGLSPIPSLIQGPILVNPAPEVVSLSPAGAPPEVHASPHLLKDLPSEADLKAQATLSLTALTDRDSRDFDVGGWQFVARPVRASAESCVHCHNWRPSTVGIDKVFGLGDPIGAVLYGYQTKVSKWAGGAAAGAQTVDWNVPASVGSQDRTAILEIARKVGIEKPSSASVRQEGCALVEVRSMPVLDGNRVLSTVVAVRQRSGPGCTSPRGGHSERKGNWSAFLGPSNPRREERWRIRDGIWHVDVLLSSDVPYDDADTIVRAIRQKQLLDRRTEPLQLSSAIRYVDSDLIRNIRRPNRGLAGPAAPGEYEVMTDLGGGGDSLSVRIRNGAVELLSHGFWQS